MSGLMYIRPAIFALFTVFILVSGTGCQKSESRPPDAPAATPGP